ncbi:MAG: CDP-diacylglycerol--serine O-phosphatidyltransferase [Bacteroidales bacterium]|nr:CDP-diacylglycerol--serine O-phosphatidyltransferase [Bacteroidales bacterium]
MSITRHIPNTITSLNLLSGTLAVIYGFKGNAEIAVYLVIAAAIFDFMDGFTARLLKSYSPMGKELDSLADLISFGLAPAVLLFHRFELIHGISLLTFIPLAIVIASALRLAKFNIDTRQSENFIGMPTPANALLICMLIHLSLYNDFLNPLLDSKFFIPIISIVLSFLLVCNVPMFSLKLKTLKWTGNELRFSLIILSIALTSLSFILGFTWSIAILTIFILYILINLINYSLTLFRQRR